MSEVGIVCVVALVVCSGLMTLVTWLLFLRKRDEDAMMEHVLATYHTSIRAQQDMWNTMVSERQIMASERKSYVEDRTALVSWLTQMAKAVDERNRDIENRIRVAMSSIVNDIQARVADVVGSVQPYPPNHSNMPKPEERS